jgi:hypothetical protein
VRVVTYSGDQRYYHYRIEVSEDGRAWRQVSAKTDDSPATMEGMEHVFPRAPARFVRIVMLFNSANVGVHVAEIGVYRDPPPPGAFGR